MGKRTREPATADITPLIDVVFLLLIFFMTSTVFKKTELALLLNLPKTESGETTETSKTKAITIELSKAGLAFNGAKINEADVDLKLGIIKNKETPIDLRVDKDVVYSRLVKILDILKKYDLSNLSLITEN